MKLFQKYGLALLTSLLSISLFAAQNKLDNTYGYENSLSNTVAGGYADYTTSSVTPATKIDPSKYAQMKALKSVDLTGVTEIGNAAFAYSALESVTIPSTVTTMGYIAFGGCTNLKSATISNWNWYGDENKEQFGDCTKLTTLIANCAPLSTMNAAAFKKLFKNVTTVQVPAAQKTAWTAKGYDVTVQQQSGQYTIVFYKDDGTTTSKSQKFEYGVATKLPAFSTFSWARKGLDFKGWATSEANAKSGKIWKTDGAVVSTPTDAGSTLEVYAVWGLKANYFGICFNKNDGSGTWRSAAYEYNVKSVLPSCEGGLGWTREGYEFKGWATSEANAAAGIIWKTDRGVVQSGIPAGVMKDIFAVWAVKTEKYTIRYIRNDGAGTLFSTNYVWGESSKLELLSNLRLNAETMGWGRRGFKFKYWSLSALSTAKEWKPDGGTIVMPTDPGTRLDIYCAWELKAGYYQIRFEMNDGTGKWRSLAYQCGVSTGLPTIENGLHWSRAGYTFGGWATSPAKAAAGTVWRKDGYKVLDVAGEGKILPIYAIWIKNPVTSYVAAKKSVSDGSADDSREFFSGELADGDGTYDLWVEKDGAAYLAVTTDSEVFAVVGEAVFDDAFIVVICGDGSVYRLLR